MVRSTCKAAVLSVGLLSFTGMAFKMLQAPGPLDIAIDPSNATVNFLFHGDWGWPGVNQTLIGWQMGNWSQAHNADFLIALGDNFYRKPLPALFSVALSPLADDGVWNDTDPLWDSVYRYVYTSPYLDIPWYVILGNHDYHRNPQAQIDYYNHHRDERWIMPGHIYNTVYPIPGGSGETLEIIFIDTARLATTETEQTAPGGIHEVTPEQKERHLRRLEHFLAHSTARWLLVAGHYTIYSMAWHGDTPDLITCLVPLLRKYHVQAYLNGHDHVLQQISWEGVEYLTSGRGALTDSWPPETYSTDKHDTLAAQGMRFVAWTPGFGTGTVSLEQLAVTFITQHGETIHTTVLTNPRTATDRHQISLENEDWTVTLIACVLIGLIWGIVCGHAYAQPGTHEVLKRWWTRCTCRPQQARQALAEQAEQATERGAGGLEAGTAAAEVELTEIPKVHPTAKQYSVVNIKDDDDSIDL